MAVDSRRSRIRGDDIHVTSHTRMLLLLSKLIGRDFGDGKDLAQDGYVGPEPIYCRL